MVASSAATLDVDPYTTWSSPTAIGTGRLAKALPPPPAAIGKVLAVVVPHPPSLPFPSPLSWTVLGRGRWLGTHGPPTNTVGTVGARP
jgi:hypothetical protein